MPTDDEFVVVATHQLRVDTLAIVVDPQVTTYEDTSQVANLNYIYRVLVVSTSGLEISSEASAPIRGPSMQQLSFYSDRTGDWEVFIMNADGSVVTNLTNHPATDGLLNSGVGRPAWSPDGSRIAFTSYRDGNAEIYVMDADGSNQVNATNHPATDRQPAWSPDGSKFVFVSTRDGDEAFEVYTMNVDGTDATRLTRNLGGDETDDFDLGPDWSPDGSRIVFWSGRDGVSTSEVYVMNADGTGVVQLTDTPDIFDFDPVWSPDGSRIAWLGGGGAGVFIMNVDGSNPVQINEGGAWPHWSADGSQISYSCGDPRWTDVCIANADGTGEVNLTADSPATDLLGAWRPVVD